MEAPLTLYWRNPLNPGNGDLISFFSDALVSEAEWPISFWKTFYTGSRLFLDFFGLVFGENFGYSSSDIGWYAQNRILLKIKSFIQLQKS